jgi:hypothetical protein
MRSLWIKIGFGAFGVFLVGMMIVTLGRQARTAAAEAISTALQSNAFSSVASAAADIPFRLSGERLGTVHHVDIRRTEPGALPDVKLDVELSDPASRNRLASCTLVPGRQQQFDFDSGFRCAEGMTGDLVPVGSVRFSPGRLERPIMVAPAMATDLRQGDPFEATADLAGEVRINARGNGGELVRLLANQHGADIKVNDELGHALLRLFADSTGASIRVRDQHGREVVNLQASKAGLSITVDTAGH